MAFANAWVESDPNGDVIFVSQLDDSDRLIKGAVRERMEGDPAAPDLTGLIEVGTWTSAPKPRKGAARIYVDTQANILTFGVTKREDGRLAIASNSRRLYHVATAGVVEIAYAPTDTPTFTGVMTAGSLVLSGDLTADDITADELVLTGSLTMNAGQTALHGGQLVIGGNSILIGRRTGWGAPSGVASRAAFDTATVTHEQLAQRMKALIDDFRAHGAIGD